MLLLGHLAHAEDALIVVKVMQHVSVLVAAEPLVFPIKTKGLVLAQKLLTHLLVLGLSAVRVQVRGHVVVRALLVRESHLLGGELGRGCLLQLVGDLFRQGEILLLALALSRGITCGVEVIGEGLVTGGHAAGVNGDLSWGAQTGGGLGAGVGRADIS